MEIKGSKTSGSLSKDGGMAFFILKFIIIIFFNLEILTEQPPGKYIGSSSITFPNGHFLCP